MVVCVFYDGSTKGSIESGSGEAEDQTCDPWFTRHNTYPLQRGGFHMSGFVQRNVICIYQYFRELANIMIKIKL